MAITISGSGIVEANLADNAVTLAKMASGTDGEILTYDASGNPIAVSVGTDGQVLTSTGAGSPPAFETAAGGGKVLQVVSTTKTDTWSHNTTTYTDVTGLSVSITPATGSKVMVVVNLNIMATNLYASAQLYRGSTQIGMGAAAGSRSRVAVGAGSSQVTNNEYRMPNSSFSYLDTAPGGDGSTSITYKIKAACPYGTGDRTLYINRDGQDEDGAYSLRGISTITVMEIGA